MEIMGKPTETACEHYRTCVGFFAKIDDEFVANSPFLRNWFLHLNGSCKTRMLENCDKAESIENPMFSNAPTKDDEASLLMYLQNLGIKLELLVAPINKTFEVGQNKSLFIPNYPAVLKPVTGRAVTRPIAPLDVEAQKLSALDQEWNYFAPPYATANNGIK